MECPGEWPPDERGFMFIKKVVTFVERMDSWAVECYVSRSGFLRYWFDTEAEARAFAEQ